MQSIPRLHTDWLSPEEKRERQAVDLENIMQSKLQVLQEDKPCPALGLSTPVQDVYDTQNLSALHEDSDSEEDTPSKGRIIRENKL